MRITGGEARGNIIKAPKGAHTRPTSIRVREALFNTIGAELSGSRVLDLFAGSGVLSIEALSRGADFAVLVENNAGAASIIKGNLEKTGFLEKAELIKADFHSALRRIHKRGDTFDLILIDPPYQANLLDEIAQILDECPLTKDQASIVLEHFTKIPAPSNIANLSLSTTRKYGQTSLSYYHGTS